MADSFESVVASIKTLTQAQIAQTAIAEHQRVMGDTPRPLGFVRHVDGVEGAEESAVKPGGVIVYDYRRLDQVVSAVLDIVRQLSPIESGDYVRSHVVMLNGTVVDNAANKFSPALSAYKPGDRITISNLMPYTRKIEIGRKGYRAHGHVYEKAAAMAANRFGNMAKVFFTYEPAPRGGGDGGMRAWSFKTRLNRGKGFKSEARRQEWLNRQPTIVIKDLI